MNPRTTTRLTTQEAAAVRELAAAAQDTDGVAPLSEQTVLHLDAPEGAHRHVLLDGEDGLQGYAHLDHVEPVPASPPGVEIVTAPRHRRTGVATRLWNTVTDLAPTARVWAHGDRPPAQAWAARAGLDVVRSLLQMARSSSGLAGAEVALPPGYSARTFTPDDIDAWVAVNARAFASHPEQGRVTAGDVRARMAESWFDADGFFLIHGPTPAASGLDGESEEGPLAAFHWTKIADGEGEVYVVGVDPSRQGLGLGKSATLLGLRHLAERGVPRITLYVDGDNAPALATYRRLGFEQSALDVMYGRP